MDFSVCLYVYTDITRLHVTFSVKTEYNATVQPERKQREMEIGYTFCEKVGSCQSIQEQW